MTIFGFNLLPVKTTIIVKKDKSIWKSQSGPWEKIEHFEFENERENN